MNAAISRTSSPQTYNNTGVRQTRRPPHHKILTRCSHKFIYMVRNSIPRQFTLINNMCFNKDSQITTNNDFRHHSFLTRRHNIQRFLNLNNNNTLNLNHQVQNSKYHKHVNRPKVKKKINKK